MNLTWQAVTNVNFTGQAEGKAHGVYFQPLVNSDRHWAPFPSGGADGPFGPFVAPSLFPSVTGL